MSKRINNQKIRKDTWIKLDVKPYNSDIVYLEPVIGKLHPYTKTYILFKEILLSFGLKEVEDKATTAQIWHSDILGLKQKNKLNSENLCYFLNKRTEIPLELVRKLEKQYLLKYGEEYDRELGSRLLLKAQTTSDLLESSYKLGRGNLFTFGRIYRRRNYRKENYHSEILLSSDRLSINQLFDFSQKVLSEVFRTRIKINFKRDYFPFTFGSFGMYGKVYGYKLKFGAFGFLPLQTSQLLGLSKYSAIIGFGINKITNSLLGLSPYEKRYKLYNEILDDTDFKI